ncbi:TetR/AcrR family transcriptional regulator [uncultured Jatrophihabitans sp.]|uniref:TetR/AcrR family transcriptional regulator n=1 Tax=uncultured Jatrophihabitans sp. TaxID=1610747 RepID=UPI0035CBD310
MTQGASANRQQQRSETSTRRLLEAAGELISEVGYTHMTLAAVGERAGYSRGIVTIKFGSKANLLAMVVDRITTGWSHKRWLPTIRDHNGLDGFLALISAINEEFQRDSKGVNLLYTLMFEAVGSNAELKEVFTEFHRSQRDDLADIVHRGVKDGSIRSDVGVEDEAAAVVSGLRGIGYQWLLDPEGFDPVPALEHLHRATEARLRPTGRG